MHSRAWPSREEHEHGIPDEWSEAPSAPRELQISREGGVLVGSGHRWWSLHLGDSEANLGFQLHWVWRQSGTLMFGSFTHSFVHSFNVQELLQTLHYIDLIFCYTLTLYIYYYTTTFITK